MAWRELSKRKSGFLVTLETALFFVRKYAFTSLQCRDACVCVHVCMCGGVYKWSVCVCVCVEMYAGG